MYEKSPKPSELVAHHIEVTIRTMCLLSTSPLNRGDAERAAIAHYESMPPGVVDVVLNEAPIYVAGLLVGLSWKEVDELSEEIWTTYRKIYEETRIPKKSPRLRLIPFLPMLKPRKSHVLKRVVQGGT